MEKDIEDTFAFIGDRQSELKDENQKLHTRLNALEAENKKLSEGLISIKSNISDTRKQRLDIFNRIDKDIDENGECIDRLFGNDKIDTNRIDTLFKNGEIYWNKIKALDASIEKQQVNQRLFEVKVQERQDKMILAMEKCIDFHNWHVDNFNEWTEAIQVALEQVHEFHKSNMSKIHDMFLNIDAPECEKPDMEGLLVDLKPLPAPPEIKKSSKWDYLGAIFH